MGCAPWRGQLSVARSQIGSVRLRACWRAAAGGDMPHEALAASLLLAMAPTPAAALRNGLGLTPPMGFDMGGGQYIGAASMNVTTLENTWGCLSGINAGINETQMMIAADFLHSSGMFKAGYTHVHSDDCWESGPGRVGLDNQKFGKGKFPDSTPFFPHGYKALGDYMHARQLQFGLYSAASAEMCAAREWRNGGVITGSLWTEDSDAKQFAGWGVDYLHYDNCGQSAMDGVAKFAPMRDAINRTGRKILIACESFLWDVDPEMKELCNLQWSTWNDMEPSFTGPQGLLDVVDQNDRWWPLTGPGFFSSPFIALFAEYGWTQTEARTHFALFVIIKAALIIGLNGPPATQMDPYLPLITNPELIAINQDPLGVQGHRLTSYRLPSIGGPGLNDSSVIVDRCDAEHNTTQRWRFVPADGGTLLTARVVTVLSVDDRCITGKLGAGGITVTPCVAGSAHQLWWLNRNARTMTAMVNNASSTPSTPAVALQINNSDWRTVSLEALAIPHSASGVPDNVNTTFTQDWYWDETREGRLLSGTFTNSIAMAPVNCDPMHTGQPTTSCRARMKDYAPYRECLSVAKDGPLQVWGGPLSGGDYAVLLLNRSPLINGSKHLITAHWGVLGLPVGMKMAVRDVIGRKDVGVRQGSITTYVAPHDVAFFRLSPHK